MFGPAEQPRMFGLPPGADFPAALVAGLRARMATSPPEAMARVTVFLNTSKMRDRVRAAFQKAGPGLLPRLRVITELGSGPVPGLPAVVPALRRRLELTRLVAELVARQRDFAPGTAVYDPADSLATLLEEMSDEGVGFDALEQPGLADDHAIHWERSLTFLRIIAPYLDDATEPDAAARQRRVIERLTSEWVAAPPNEPIIVAGSTGSRGATALLMEAVARLPQGAVVLPGYDFDMPVHAWNSLYSGGKADEDHPQFRFIRLLNSLGIDPMAVRPWRPDTAPDPDRNRLLSLALRPAPVTDQWLDEGAGLLPLASKATGMTLIEAPNARSEAISIALILREAAETGQTAALVAADRTLVRRVIAALDRWGIAPDDSAGLPLPLSAPGRLLRHVAGLFGRQLTAETLLTLLKHPLTATGAGGRGNHLRFTRDLELSLRRKGPPFPVGADIRRWDDERKVIEAERGIWANWIANWIDTCPQDKSAALSDYLDALVLATETLAAGPGGQPGASELWEKSAGRLALSVIDGLRAEAGHGGVLSAAAFSDLLTSLLQKEPVRDAEPSHPQITIKGTREAREAQADLVILAGLNEGIWPQPARPDPWLSRQMRLKVGLLVPERQIGLSAHDFQLAAGARTVVLSRAVRDDEAQTVPSRWLDRLTNLMEGLEGDTGALAAMRERGRNWLKLAVQYETVAPTPGAPRPAPRPPVSARPRELPVTAITRLIRDPYAIYARYVLRLRALDPLRPEPDPLSRGKVLHAIVERFVGDRPQSESLTEARERLLRVSAEVLATETPWPSAQRLWLARIARFADRFIADEAARFARGTPALIEKEGAVDLVGLGFRLTARPDRIDQREDGALHIYDYKSGEPPSKNQLKHFEKQLPLEAAMAERGAFAEIGPQPVEGCSFIQLGGEGKTKVFSRDELGPDQEWERLQTLITAYFRPDKGYSARRAVFKAEQTGDYDHLARFGEWQMSDIPVPEDLE
jgi:ATP-dependent helicase/nuclease subunit B